MSTCRHNLDLVEGELMAVLEEARFGGNEPEETMRATLWTAVRNTAIVMGLAGILAFGPSCFLVDECDTDYDCDSDEECNGGDCEYVSPTYNNYNPCADTSEDCSDTSCCDSSDVCVNFSSKNYIHCAARCTDNSGCVSNCCLETQQGSWVCHASSYCN